MSSLALKAENNEWYLNARWIVFRRRPSPRALRAQAQKIGATHYIIERGATWVAGFFTFEDGIKLKTILPAALAVAKHLGPNAYGTLEPVPGKLWIIATDANGCLLPFADTVLSGDDLGPFEARLDPQLLEHRVNIDLTGVDALLPIIEARSFKAVAVGTPRTLIVTGLFLAVCVGIGGCAWLWHQHEMQIVADAAAELKRRVARNARIEQERLTVVTPDDWVAACMRTEENTPIYAAGWIAREWFCDATTFSIIWIRAGGTLAHAPVGQADNKGETIISRLALQPRRVRPTPSPSGDAVRLFLTLLQDAGVNAELQPEAIQPGGAPQGNAPSVVASTQFDWPTDPRSTNWNTVPRLELVSIHASTGLVSGGGATGAPAGQYRIRARILTGAPS